MRVYLTQKKYQPEYIEVVLEMLEKEKYLNDENLARRFVADRQNFKPRSRQKLNAEMRKKGIDSATVELVLSELDQDDQALAIRTVAEKKLRQARYQDKAKLTEYLLRQGFYYSDVKQALEEVEFTEPS
jgi:regulatory protein